MILAYHAIVTAYGFWLPNDPRGSWSDFIRAWELLHFGEATKTDARRSVARKPHDAQKRAAAKKWLQYPPVVFDGRQALAVAKGFELAIEEGDYKVLACSILPEHVHLVIRRHERKPQQIASHLKARATQRLKAEQRHPLAAFSRDDGSLPSPWARRAWVVYIDREERVPKTIEYVENNPLREGKKPQRWGFVESS